MQVQPFATGDDFKRDVWPFLLEREAVNNLIIGISGTIAEHPNAYGDAPPYLAAVYDDAGRVVAAAVRTPPRGVILSHDAPEPALKALAADLHAVYSAAMRGCVATSPTDERFAAIWRTLTGCTVRIEMAQRIYRCATVTPPPHVSGAARTATRDDLDLLADWYHSFAVEATPEQYSRDDAIQAVERLLTTPEREIVVWEDGGALVAMAAATGPTPHGMRVGPVYTPPDQRRRRYGAAVTAAVTRRQFDAGRQFCFLYTDLSNPTSNSIYMKIGYEPVCDSSQIAFDCESVGK